MIDTDLVDRVVARARELSQLQAALLADLVAVADATPNPEFVAFEISYRADLDSSGGHDTAGFG